MRAAAAPLIALTEDFCAPADGWAEALLDARARVPALAIGGPIARRGGRAADWALTFVEYGRFFRREPEGDVFDLPAVNVAYDAGRLLEAIPPDATGLFEVQVHPRLRARGGRFWRVPAAVMFDENRVPLSSAVRAQYHHGRIFGAGRVEGRGALPRVVRGALAAAVPAVLLNRIAREVMSAGSGREMLRALPALSVMLGGWALGEAAGSLFGEGRSGASWT